MTGGRRKERVVMSEEGIVESKGRRREGEEEGRRDESSMFAGVGSAERKVRGRHRRGRGRK